MNLRTCKNRAVKMQLKINVFTHGCGKRLGWTNSYQIQTDLNSNHMENFVWSHRIAFCDVTKSQDIEIDFGILDCFLSIRDSVSILIKFHLKIGCIVEWGRCHFRQSKGCFYRNFIMLEIYSLFSDLFYSALYLLFLLHFHSTLSKLSIYKIIC